eukprot:248544_1
MIRRANTMFASNTFDKLALQNKPYFLKFLKKNGEKTEKLVYSNYVIKINNKGKRQKRLLIITDQAIYNVGINSNIKKSALGKLKRRIELHQIHAITVSCISDEFVLHAPNEYDYLYQSDEKNSIAKIIEYILHSQKKSFQIVYVQQSSLSNLANVDQKSARKQTVNERLENYWQARNAMKRNGIEQEEDAEASTVTFDYKGLIQALKKDADQKSYDNKYNLEVKSDTEMLADPTMDPDLIGSTDIHTTPTRSPRAQNDDLTIPCNDYTEIDISPAWMEFAALMLDTNEGHQIVLVKHIINKRYYILNITDKAQILSEKTWFNKYHQLSLFRNIESFKSSDYRNKNHLDFSLFRGCSKLELVNKVELNVLDVDTGEEDQIDPDLDIKHIRDYDANQILWNDEFCARDFMVRKYSIVCTPKSLIEVTSYHNAGDLAVCLQMHKDKRFTFKQCKFLIAQVVLAMHYVHTNMNYIIYDLKPENIYIDSSGYIAISEIESLDALRSNISKDVNIFGGAPEYLAPEILNKDVANVSTKCDYWSLGILIYELLVGLPPFFDDDMDRYEDYLTKTDRYCARTVQNNIMRLSTHRMRFPEHMDIRAKRLISKLLVIDPNQRLSGFNEIIQEQFFEGILWKQILYKAWYMPFKPPKLKRFGKVLSTLHQDWSGRKILNAWFQPVKLNSEQRAVFGRWKLFDEPSSFKYFPKRENQI